MHGLCLKQDVYSIQTNEKNRGCVRVRRFEVVSQAQAKWGDDWLIDIKRETRGVRWTKATRAGSEDGEKVDPLKNIM